MRYIDRDLFVLQEQRLDSPPSHDYRYVIPYDKQNHLRDISSGTLPINDQARGWVSLESLSKWRILWAQSLCSDERNRLDKFEISWAKNPA